MTVSLDAWEAQRRTLCHWLYDRDLIPTEEPSAVMNGWSDDHHTIGMVLASLKLEGRPTDAITLIDEITTLGATYVVEALPERGSEAFIFGKALQQTIALVPTLLDPALLQEAP